MTEATFRLSLSTILESVASENGISPAALCGRSRMKPFPRLRQEFCRRARDLGYTTTQIGRAFNRDHSTVLYLLGRLSGKQLGGESNRHGFIL